MRRITFLKTFLVAGTVLAGPLNLLAKLKSRTTKGIRVLAGKDRFDKPITIFDSDIFYTKVSGKDTDGDLWMFESTRLIEGGPALHLHYEQDELWYIIQGEFLFQVGEESFTAKAGDTVFGPRNVPHAFAKVGVGEAKLLMVFQPAGKMEEFFQKISAGARKNMNKVEQLAFEEAHGIKEVGPALRQEKR